MRESSFEDLMARLQKGDAEAATEIFRRFAYRLVGLARDRLAMIVRPKEDPEDVVQSVFRSFFARQAEGQFAFAGWNDLWNLLAMITLRKCGHRIEHYRAACRDVQREAAPPRSDSDSVSSWQFIARDPSPSEAAMLIETIQSLMDSFSERDRAILEFSLQGERPIAISERLSCAERTVERVLERIRQRLEKMMTETSSFP